MKKSGCFLVLAVVAGVFVLSGCGQVGSTAKQKPAYKTNTCAMSTSTPVSTSCQSAGKIPEGKAVIYIYRPRMRMGKIPFDVSANGKTLATLVPDGYYAYVSEPGQIEFMATDGRNPFSMTLDVKAGQAYYVKGKDGKFGGSAHLELVSPQEGMDGVSGCNEIK